jgi:hypothetical protein
MRAAFILLATLYAMLTSCVAQTNTGTGLPRIVAKAYLTINSADGTIPLTTILTPTTSSLYRITVYWNQTIAPANCSSGQDCGFLEMPIQWTDEGGAQNNYAVPSGKLFGSDPQYFTPVSGSLIVRVKANTPLTYFVSGDAGGDGGATYELLYVVEQLM